MKALLAIALLALVAIYFLAEKPVQKKPSVNLATAKISEPAGISNDGSIPVSFRQWAHREGFPSDGLKAHFEDGIAKMEALRLFKGKVIQHLQDGDLLVNVWTIKPGQKCVSQGDVAVFGVPDAAGIADDLELDCMVVPVGTYQFTTTAGATRTIYEMMYVPADWKPQPAAAANPQPAKQLFPETMTVDQRRVYLQQQTALRLMRSGR